MSDQYQAASHWPRTPYCAGQAAFTRQTPLDSLQVCLLIDDVMTTGATVKYATRTLIAAGATTVWVASISRQPLD